MRIQPIDSKVFHNSKASSMPSAEEPRVTEKMAANGMLVACLAVVADHGGKKWLDQANQASKHRPTRPEL